MKIGSLYLKILGISLLGMLLLICVIHPGYAYIYFSGARNIYGSGAGILGLYGGLGNIYGLGLPYYSGLYDLNPVYSGLMAFNPMNTFNLYGLGGLYQNILNPLAMGGIYGLAGIYWPYGIVGGLNLSGILGGFQDLDQILNIQSLFGSPQLLTSSVQNLQANILTSAEQAGIWKGTWFSLTKISSLGEMTLTLAEDTVNGLLLGEVNLLLNTITSSIPAQVKGYYTGGSIFTLSGGNNTIFTNTLLLVPTATLYSIQLNCTLTSPLTMTGTYIIQDLVKLVNDDIGNFNLILASPVI